MSIKLVSVSVIVSGEKIIERCVKSKSSNVIIVSVDTRLKASSLFISLSTVEKIKKNSVIWHYIDVSHHYFSSTFV